MEMLLTLACVQRFYDDWAHAVRLATGYHIGGMALTATAFARQAERLEEGWITGLAVLGTWSRG